MIPRRTHLVALAIAVAATMPATASAQQDLRTADAVSPFSAPADLRAPDGAQPYNGVPVEVVRSAPVVRTVDNGFDWSDAGLGAAGLLTIVLLSAGGTAVVRRHHHHPAMG
jgi:hypothetical protein